jgi:hypothetical protein
MAITKVTRTLLSTGIVDNSNATAITIDSSENVGIGTTSPSSELHVVGKITADTHFTSSDTNATLSTSGSGGAVRLRPNGSGSSTGQFTVQSTGNVGIGTDSPAAVLEVKGSPVATGDTRYELILSEDNTASTGRGGGLAFARQGVIYGGIKTIQDTSSDSNASMYFQTVTGGSNTTKMKLDSSGNVGIGETSPDRKLHVNSGNTNECALFESTDTEVTIELKDTTGTAAIKSRNDFRFTAGGSERMRISASGRLLVGGSTDRGGNICVGGTSTTARVIPQSDNVGYVGEATFRWQAIYAVNGSIQTSDEREKTEIKETTLGLDFIKDLKPVSYKWIDGEQQDKGKDEREHQGLIAQQVAETVEKHGVNKNDFGGLDIQKTEKYDDFHGMSYDQLIAPLIKAIQEQQTIIDDLKTRIETLENV